MLYFIVNRGLFNQTGYLNGIKSITFKNLSLKNQKRVMFYLKECILVIDSTFFIEFTIKNVAISSKANQTWKSAINSLNKAS